MMYSFCTTPNNIILLKYSDTFMTRHLQSALSENLEGVPVMDNLLHLVGYSVLQKKFA